MSAEVETHVASVEALYKPLITGSASLLRGGAKLWAQFESAAVAFRDDASAQTISSVIERVNELAVARLIMMDPRFKGELHYEPDILPDDRRIDFVIFGPDRNIYIEVKTVHPRAEDSEENWGKYIERRERHPKNVHYIVDWDWLGAQIYGNTFSARAHFLDYAVQFETRLAAAKTVRPGSGILAFCGTGGPWRCDHLEDFADFYLTRRHRADDPFAEMESHHLQTKRIELLRNISAFAYIERGMERVKPSRCVMPVRGPRGFAA
jgi:hypothetical protein